MNLAQIRRLLWSQVDLAPEGSNELYTRTREFIDRAVKSLQSDAPFLFERDFDVLFDKDVRSQYDASATDGKQLHAWFSSTTAFDRFSLALGVSRGTNATLFEEIEQAARSHRARWFEYVDPRADQEGLGLKYERHRIRDIYVKSPEIPDPDQDILVMTLERGVPYDDPGFGVTLAGDFSVKEWRITTHYYVLPEEVKEVKSLTLVDGRGSDIPIEMLTTAQAADRGYNTTFFSSEVSGRPAVAWPGPKDALRAPRAAPTVAASAQVWNVLGVPEGTFEYALSYSWGWRHEETADINPMSSTSNELRLMPVLESALSPAISDEIETSGQAVTVTVPNLAELLGFDDNTLLRYRRHGLVVHVYRRRVALAAGSPSWPESDHFYHIGDVDHAVDGVLVFTDDGTAVEGRVAHHRDYYNTLHIYPTPDTGFRLRMRGQPRPTPMVDDADVPEVPSECIDALIERASAYLLRAGGNRGAAADADQRYYTELHKLRRRAGDQRVKGRGIKRTLARGRPRYRRGHLGRRPDQS